MARRSVGVLAPAVVSNVRNWVGSRHKEPLATLRPLPPTIRTNRWRIDHHGSSRTFIVVRGGSLPGEEPSRLDFRALREGDGVINIDA